MRFLSTGFLVCAGACGCVANSFAQTSAEKLAQTISAQHAEHGVPALAAAVVLDGKLVAANAVGVRRWGASEKVTAEDRFHVGSCTKAMTATLAAMWVERGKISWKTTLAEVFPDTAPTMHEGFRAVTLEQLLAHRGGAPENLDADGLWGRIWKHRGTPSEQRLFLLREVTQRAPVVIPDSKFVYSNAGYAMAGAMLERVTGQDWEEQMREMIFAPLGMKRAGFGAPASVGKVDAPWGHVVEKGEIKRCLPGPAGDNPPAIGPGGTVHCSIADLGRFANFHLQGARAKGKLLQPETFARLQTPAAGHDYALGWGIAPRDWAGGNALTHSGTNTMFYAVVWIAPEKNFAVVVATNLGGEKAEAACDKTAWALIQKFLGAK